MDFRRTGSSDERRRRVLRDDIVSPAGDNEGKKESSSRGNPNRRYNDGAASVRQPRITDFIPKRAFSLVVPALLLLTFAAAIEAAYTTAAVRGAFARDGRYAALNPAERGSVATWFASSLLTVSAAMCWVIYRVRMHRVDDFRGRYRIWIVAAAALAWAGLDAGTGVHHAISAAIEFVAGKPFLGSGHGWWLAIYLALFGSLAVRLLFEVVACRPAVACLAAAALLLAAATLVTTNAFPIHDPIERNVAQSGFFLLGHSALALAVLCYARHVYLDAQGLLTATGAMKVKKKRKVAAKSEETDAAAEPEAKAKTAPAAAKSTAPAAKKAEEDEEAEDDEAATVGMQGGPLSKSERKKMKRMQQPVPQRRAA